MISLALASVSVAQSAPNTINASTPLDIQASASIFTAPGTLYLSTLAPAQLGIVRVEYYVVDTPEQPLATVNQAPFGVNIPLTSQNDGTYVFFAKGYDRAGRVYNSGSITVQVNIGTNSTDTRATTTATTTPTVTLSTPQTTITTVAPVTLNMAYQGFTPSRIEFYEGSTLIGRSDAPPFNSATLSFDASDNGSYALKIKAFDAQGRSYLSNALNLIIKIGTPTPTAPKVTLQVSAATVSSSQTWQATATPSADVSKLEFYLDGKLQSTLTKAPYMWQRSWSSAENGAHVVSVKAYNAAGVAVSANQNVQVNVPVATTPTVSLSASQTTITSVAPITLSMKYQGFTPSRIEFYDGTTLIGQSGTAPFDSAVLSFDAGDNGSYNILIKAFDAQGRAYSSNVVMLKIQIGTPTPTAPTVSLQLSANTVTAANQAWQATATPSANVSKVEFYLDGVLKSTVTAAPFIWKASYTEANNGNRNIVAKAYTAAGVSVVANQALSVAIPVAPTAPLTAALALQKTSGNVLTLGVTTNATLQQLQIFESSKPTTAVVTATTATVNIDLSSYADGVYTFFAKVTDTAGRSANSNLFAVRKLRSQLYSSQLQQVQLKVFNSATCSKAYVSGFTNNMTCAGTTTGGFDACQGDSGGPLLQQQAGAWMQVGVVSFGAGCARAEYPGIYTRLPNYVDWIYQYAPKPKSDRIVGGTGASIKEFPWVVPILQSGINSAREAHFCGGTLIAANWVLTAAHCVTDGNGQVYPANIFQVSYGQDNLAGDVPRINVSRVIRHPNYNDSTYDSDLALLELSSPVTTIAPVKIGSNPAEGEAVTVIGWGGLNAN